MQGFETCKFQVGDLVRVEVNPKPGINYTAAGRVRGRGSGRTGRIYWVELSSAYPQAKERDWYLENKMELDREAMDFEDMDNRSGSVVPFVAIIAALAALAAFMFLA